MLKTIEDNANNIEWIKNLLNLGFSLNSDLGNNHNLAELILLKTEKKEVVDYVFNKYLSEMSFLDKKSINDNMINLKFIYECMLCDNKMILFSAFNQYLHVYPEVKESFFNMKKCYFSSLLLKGINTETDRDSLTFCLDIIMKEGDSHKEKESWEPKIVSFIQENIEKNEFLNKILCDVYIKNSIGKEVREPLNLTKMISKLYFSLPEESSNLFVSKTLPKLIESLTENKNIRGLNYDSMIEPDLEILLRLQLKNIIEKGLFSPEYKDYLEMLEYRERSTETHAQIEKFKIYTESKLLKDVLKDSVKSANKVNRI